MFVVDELIATHNGYIKPDLLTGVTKRSAARFAVHRLGFEYLEDILVDPARYIGTGLDIRSALEAAQEAASNDRYDLRTSGVLWVANSGVSEEYMRPGIQAVMKGYNEVYPDVVEPVVAEYERTRSELSGFLQAKKASENPVLMPIFD